MTSYAISDILFSIFVIFLLAFMIYLASENIICIDIYSKYVNENKYTNESNIFRHGLCFHHIYEYSVTVHILCVIIFSCT